MSLHTINLHEGREARVVDLRVSATYAGLIEGYPNPRLNEAILERAGRTERPSSNVPVHVIEPARSYPECAGGPGPFGPAELLPAVTCRATLISTAVKTHHDPVLYRSWLTVVWFQPDIAAPLGEHLNTILADLPWDDLAEDQEL
jgi:hypothetical protein